MFVIAKTLINVTFVGQDKPVRHKTQIKRYHTCNLINTCNRISACQRNKSVENWYRLKSCQLNKFPKEGSITKSY